MKQAYTLLLLTLLLTDWATAQTWVQKTDYPGTARNRGRAFSVPAVNKGYVIGGYDGIWPLYQQDTYEYDPVLDSWTKKTNFPGASTVQCAFGINDKGYAGTGVTYSNYDSTFWEYDPALDTWTKMPHYPGVPRAYAVAFSIGGKGYMGGGSNGYISYQDFYVFDQATHTWDTMAPCPALGAPCGAVGWSIGNKGYVAVGAPSQDLSSFSKEIWEYDPATNIWTRKTDFPGVGRAEGMGFATCDKGYVGVGYIVQSQSTYAGDWYQYDPIKDTWKQVAGFGKWAYGTGFGLGKSGYVGLGYDSIAITKGWWEFHDIAAVAFTTIGSSTTTICAGQSVSYQDTSTFAPTNWQWTFPGGIPGSSTLNNPVVRYDTAGTYNVTLMAWNGCDTATQIFTTYVTVTPAGTLTATANPPSICGGQTSAIAVSGGGTYTWGPATGLSATTGASVTANPTVTTTYTVTSAGSGCPATGQVVITVANNTVAGAVTAPNDTLCEGTTGMVVLNGNTSDSIQWQSSTDGVNFTDISGADTTFYNTNPLTQTTYYRAVVGKGMCTDTTRPPFMLFVPPALTASFSSAVTGTNTVTFTSTSVGNITFYSWDFGDGGTSNATNPTHTYAAGTDTVNVCLTIYDGSNCSFTFCKDVTLATGIHEAMANGWNIYPSPVSNQLIIESKTGEIMESVTLYDVLGRDVFLKTTLQATHTTLNVSALAQGVYFVQITTATGSYIKKVVKE